MDPIALDYDPQPPERQWYRSTTTGDRGYIVRRGGVEVIRLDRPMQELIKPKTGEWIADEYGSLLLESQAAMVAFAADRALCAVLGLYSESRKTWQELSDRDRSDFINKGPNEAIRIAVYRAIASAMTPYMRGD